MESGHARRLAGPIGVCGRGHSVDADSRLRLCVIAGMGPLLPGFAEVIKDLSTPRFRAAGRCAGILRNLPLRPANLGSVRGSIDSPYTSTTP